MAKARMTIPAAFVVAACNVPDVNDGGYDASVDAGPQSDGGSDGGLDGGPCHEGSVVYNVTTDDAGVRCECEPDFFSPLSDGGYPIVQLCDYDVTNPCNLGCEDPVQADGGRAYDVDGGPLCFC
jgi:hypothetical protein